MTTETETFLLRFQVWMGVLIPRVCAQQRDRACPDVEGAVEHTPGPMAGHGDAHLLPTTTVTTR